MAATVRTEKELAKALKNNEDTIIIEGDLAKGVIRIKATGKIAWALAIASITTIVILVVPTGGTAAPAAAALAPVAVAALGVPATISCISIAAAGGGIGVLNKLRSYKLLKKNGECILKK